jgi:hypothetical protein
VARLTSRLNPKMTQAARFQFLQIFSIKIGLNAAVWLVCSQRNGGTH